MNAQQLKRFERQNRYIVFKIKDVTEYLNESDKETLLRLATKCTLGRISCDKQPLQCVVVESDWPEYEPTWAAIEKRMSGVATPCPSKSEAPTSKAIAAYHLLEKAQALLHDADAACTNGCELAATVLVNLERGQLKDDSSGSLRKMALRVLNNP